MKTRYFKLISVNTVLVLMKNKGYWHNDDNTTDMTVLDLTHADYLTDDLKEITYHQFIMWLCFGEPII